MSETTTGRKRRGRGEGSVFQRSDGRWSAIIDLGLDDFGKRRRKTLYGRTGAEVRSKLAKAQREHSERRLALSSPTVETWLRYWLDEACPVRPKTLATYRSYVDRHIVPAIGRIRLDRLTQADVRRLYAALRRQGKADGTIRQIHAILARALVIAQREGKVSANVCDKAHLEPPKVGDNPRTPLTRDQARAVLAASAGDPYESRWYAALYLGLRQGEALGLRWSDIDLAAGTLAIERALQRIKGGGLVYVEPKSRRSKRVIPLPTVVASRLAVDRAKHLAAGGHPDAPVWSSAGKPLDPSRDAKRWKALLDKAAVPHVALHAARNTAGTLLAAAGVPTKFASEILGHATTAVTERHYQQGNLQLHREALAALEAYVGG